MLLYIHGFNSSPASYKATLFREWLDQHYHELVVEIPYLKPYPAESIKQLETLVEHWLQTEAVTVVGSSLGGFYATWLAEKYNLKAVLVNPSVKPFETLAAYLGENKNFYNDDHYLFEQQHVEELKRFYLPQLQRVENYLLMVQTGDETLDFREATAKYCHSQNIIEYGGDHGFRHFERWFSYIMRFLAL